MLGFSIIIFIRGNLWVVFMELDEVDSDGWRIPEVIEGATAVTARLGDGHINICS